MGRGFDLTPAFVAIVVAFVAIALFDFARSWPDAHRGLLIFERACPIYHAAEHVTHRTGSAVPRIA
jgi:hypothetical protein